VLAGLGTAGFFATFFLGLAVVFGWGLAMTSVVSVEGAATGAFWLAEGSAVLPPVAAVGAVVFAASVATAAGLSALLLLVLSSLLPESAT
jgi:hypothetical protein